jgi:hypothetical protein
VPSSVLSLRTTSFPLRLFNHRHNCQLADHTFRCLRTLYLRAREADAWLVLFHVSYPDTASVSADQPRRYRNNISNPGFLRRGKRCFAAAWADKEWGLSEHRHWRAGCHRGHCVERPAQCDRKSPTVRLSQHMAFALCIYYDLSSLSPGVLYTAETFPTSSKSPPINQHETLTNLTKRYSVGTFGH